MMNSRANKKVKSSSMQLGVVSLLKQLFADVLRSVLSSVTDILPFLTNQVEAILIRRCCDALTPVKSLPGQFRATSQKHIPSKPSTFVPLILRPIKLFFGIGAGEGDAKALRKDFCVPISTNVVEAVSNRYVIYCFLGDSY